MAKKLLESTERKLENNSEKAEAYQKFIEEYLVKNYIHRLSLDGPSPTTEWLLPHFPVVRADRTTTKKRFVPGPKVQADMLIILVRFRKEVVALVGDVRQMFHQLALTLEDSLKKWRVF